MPDLSTPQGIVAYVAGGGSAVIVAVLFSAFGERWPWFQTLNAEAKGLVMKGGSGMIAVAVYLVFTLVPPDAAKFIAALVGIFALGIGASFVNQMAHAVRKMNDLKVSAQNSEGHTSLVTTTLSDGANPPPA